MAAWLHGLPENVWRDYQAELKRVTIDQAQLLARKWIPTTDLSWVVCGSPNALDESRPILEGMGKPVQHVEIASLVD